MEAFLDGKLFFFSCVFSLVKTDALPVSEPVPAVVGKAIIGKIESALALVHQSPISSKSQIGLSCLAMNAIAFPVSIPEPPPTAITPSCLFSLNTLTPSSTFLPVGFDHLTRAKSYHIRNI